MQSKKYRQEYYQKNKEKILKRTHDWYRNNREYAIRRQVEYAKGNPNVKKRKSAWHKKWIADPNNFKKKMAYGKIYKRAPPLGVPCTLCGKDAMIEHDIKWWKTTDGWDGETIPVCKKCHTAIHFKKELVHLRPPFEPPYDERLVVYNQRMSARRRARTAQAQEK